MDAVSVIRPEPLVGGKVEHHDTAPGRRTRKKIPGNAKGVVVHVIKDIGRHHRVESAHRPDGSAGSRTRPREIFTFGARNRRLARPAPSGQPAIHPRRFQRQGRAERAPRPADQAARTRNPHSSTSASLPQAGRPARGPRAHAASGKYHIPSSTAASLRYSSGCMERNRGSPPTLRGPEPPAKASAAIAHICFGRRVK